MSVRNLTAAALLVAALGLAGCQKPAALNPIVGTWIVKDPNAPFPVHMYVFNADGTMQQANPDAGDPRASDSDGKGVWVARDGAVRGKWGRSSPTARPTGSPAAPRSPSP